jgi:lysophospholipase L1-like esterase
VPAPRRSLAAVPVAVAVVLVALLGAAPPAAARTADARPTAVVALGDSGASGEGAGDYEPGTRGEGGDWCHRSAHAYVHRSGLAEEAVNLACSGARAEHVAFGTATRYGEGSQAQRLAEVAGRYRVTAVVLQVGANDAGVVPTGIRCIRALLDPAEPPCRETVGPVWRARTAAGQPGVERAVGDVRAAMRGAGYADADYAFVLASYASPATERMAGVPAARGCPYSRADAAWLRTVAFPTLSAALHEVAAHTGVRFLDLSRATEGYEACARTPANEEWQRRITVDAEALVYGGLDAIGYHLAQESFHPSAAGHAEMGRCVREFVRSGVADAACRVGADGRLHAEPAPADARPGVTTDATTPDEAAA